jgi:hypothetical protein
MKSRWQIQLRDEHGREYRLIFQVGIVVAVLGGIFFLRLSGNAAVWAGLAAVCSYFVGRGLSSSSELSREGDRRSGLPATHSPGAVSPKSHSKNKRVA